ncbi:PaaI family thioesterase [Pseudomonas eucalypticola]|uniref:PaaI family thioesterase n=1 Tax=Pseudomonas eucalypticola TaxID=2599595 RepID=A0A7D5H5Y3_9PSED|nr:PaaI family thioesterase [Pseudomonas eucalypticola]QKZ03864.1 PaaI family thioesterase [Pseudomonas eucalypticola]
MIDPALRERIRVAHAQNDYTALLALIPYATLIGIQCRREDEGVLYCLPAKRGNIGNPLLPALHGGVIAGFMELAAALHLMLFTDTGQVPKIIDFSIDYLRAGLYRDTYARCQLWRQGRRVTNVAITAWQASAGEPIATARAHFKIDEHTAP